MSEEERFDPVSVSPIYSEKCISHEVADYDDCDLLPLGAEGPYRPRLVGIGPGCRNWELVSYKGKNRYASKFSEDSGRYISEMDSLVDKAWCCYKDKHQSYSTGARWGFAKMLFVDSCFIVELFRKYMRKELRDNDDPIFNTGQTLHLLRRDLISIGNQLPFFVLLRFFNMTRTEDDPRDNLIDLALHFFHNMVGHTLESTDQFSIYRVKHLLGLVHDCLCRPFHPFDEEVNPRNMEMDIEIECEFINCATELQEAGIKFEKFKVKMFKGKSLLDIKFENGVMRIPALKVADSTMYLLQNLIEYEKQFPISRPRYVTDYAKFMRCLINTPKDVELLRRSGIMENWIGNDEVICTTLNKLGSETELSSNFTYSGVLKKANRHCKHRRNKWMANLWRNYFNSPWAFVSFVAAVVLLLLTLTQTVFTILSYHP